MELHLIGNIETILRGEVDTLNTAPSKKFFYALGGGGTLEQLGEAIVLKGVNYVYTPQRSFQVEELDTAFLVGFSEQPRDKKRIGTCSSIDSLYEQLLAHYTKGFVVTGGIYFSRMNGAFLKESPTQKECINEHKEKYWGTDSLENTKGEIVGICLPNGDPRMIYINPNEPPPKTFSHTHVLSEKGVRHLLTTSSIISAELFLQGLD